MNAPAARFRSISPVLPLRCYHMARLNSSLRLGSSSSFIVGFSFEFTSGGLGFLDSVLNGWASPTLGVASSLLRALLHTALHSGGIALCHSSCAAFITLSILASDSVPRSCITILPSASDLFTNSGAKVSPPTRRGHLVLQRLPSATQHLKIIRRELKWIEHKKKNA